VTAARAAAMNATTVDEKLAADKALSGALAGLRVSLEAYPELKANQNFLQLQNELADIENKLSAARRFFNSTTRELNNACEVFPNNIVAGMFGFKRAPMYEATENRETLNKAPEVKF
jgi:LemA protein